MPQSPATRASLERSHRGSGSQLGTGPDLPAVEATSWGLGWNSNVAPCGHGGLGTGEEGRIGSGIGGGGGGFSSPSQCPNLSLICMSESAFLAPRVTCPVSFVPWHNKFGHSLKRQMGLPRQCLSNQQQASCQRSLFEMKSLSIPNICKC